VSERADLRLDPVADAGREQAAALPVVKFHRADESLLT
jgi:hypothetical protein